MAESEAYSWLFVSKKWSTLKRMPTPDKGFEESFREHICNKISFDSRSSVRDLGLGLSYATLSDTPHELDLVCIKGKQLFVFELKHYETSRITKEIVFTFFGKVLDFYLKNLDVLSDFEIYMLLVTINQDLDDSIRKLCITYGIRLIEPSLMTMRVMEYYLRDLYQRTVESDSELGNEVEELIMKIEELEERYDYTFSDIFRCRESRLEIDMSLLEIVPANVLNKICEYNYVFEKVKEEWKSRRQ